MTHDHDHHGHVSGGRLRTLTIALALTAGFTIAEIVGGFITGSLALLADAGHMISDAASLGVALFAAWLAERPPTPQRSFGYKRAEILAALANGITLVVISIWIFIEAFHRFQEPPHILGGWMLVVAVIGLVVNVAVALVLSRSPGQSLNVEGAFRHVVADALGSIGAIAAALVIIFTGWNYADPIISALIGLLILGSSWKLLRDSANILLEASPSEIDAKAVGREMATAPGVAEVHDLHIWTITSGFPALAAHVLVSPGEDCHVRRRDLEKLLLQEYGIEHTTLQMDHVGDHTVHGVEFLPKNQRVQ